MRKASSNLRIRVEKPSKTEKGKGSENLQYLRTVEQLCVSTYGRNTRLRGQEQTQYLKQTKKWHFKLP